MHHCCRLQVPDRQGMIIFSLQGRPWLSVTASLWWPRLWRHCLPVFIAGRLWNECTAHGGEAVDIIGKFVCRCHLGL